MATEQIEADKIDLDALGAWMDTQGLGTGKPIENLTPLAGGTQNVMVIFTAAGAASCSDAARGTCVRGPTRRFSRR